MAKSSKSTKKVISRSKSTTSRSKSSFFKNKLFLIIGLALVGLVGIKMVYSVLVQPSGINEITAGFSKQDAPMKVDSNGCYEKQIQCVKAPCNPIMVCPAGVSPAPVATKGGEVCTQEAGTCLNGVGECVGYTDGCQKGKMCGKDFKQCNMTKPSPVASPISCACPPGARCKMDARCNPNPTTKPTPTPTPSVRPTSTPAPTVNAGLTSFTASKACGNDGYLYITYACNNQKNLITLTENVCLDFYSAIKKATSLCNTSGTATPDMGRTKTQ